VLRRRIGYKLTAAVGATALVTISVFAFVSIRSHGRGLLAEVERHANQLSEAVKSGTEYDMLGNQRERIHESIKRMGQQSSIERIRVLNKSGAVIYSSDAAEIGKMVDKKAESCFLCHSAGRPIERLNTKERTRVFRLQPGGPRTLGIINPIYNAPSCWTAACHAHPRSQVVLGVLDVTLPLAEADRDIRRVWPSDATSLSIWELNYLLDKVKVKEFMTRKVVTTMTHTSLAAAAKVMLDRKISCLPVVEKGAVVGILTQTDLVLVLASLMAA